MPSGEDWHGIKRNISVLRPWLTIAGFSSVFFVLAFLGIASTRETGRIAALWLPNAFLVAVLLRSTERGSAKIVACGMFGDADLGLAARNLEQEVLSAAATASLAPSA